MRKLKKSDLVGKTIIDIENESANCLLITFDDETELELWCEPAVSTNAGEIWGIFVDDEDDEEDE